MDASLKNTSNWLSSYSIKNNPISEALGLPSSDYGHLKHPVKDYLRIFNYTRSKNIEFSILELYNAFKSYLKEILKEMYSKDPMKIVGKVNTQSLTYVEIVTLGSYENISEKMTNSVFRKLEDEKSTPKLLEKILCHTSISLDESLKNKALMYLEMRHLIIHNDGKADERFKQSYGTLLRLKADDKLPTTFDTVREAIQCINSLSEAIDIDLITSGLLDRR